MFESASLLGSGTVVVFDTGVIVLFGETSADSVTVA